MVVVTVMACHQPSYGGGYSYGLSNVSLSAANVDAD
jgi:hypothetical protein